MLFPVLAAAACCAEALPADLVAMDYNNPDAEVRLECGIWPLIRPRPRNGRIDLYGSWRSTPSEGKLHFENLTPANDLREPLFAKGDAASHAQMPPYPPSKRGYWPPVDRAKGLPPGCRDWRMVDLTGDGFDDAVVAIDYWKDYGCGGPACPVAYDANGDWTNAPVTSVMYWFRREGGKSGTWSAPMPLVTVGSDHMAGPWGGCSPQFRDWDGDGDLDIVHLDFRSDFWYFENVGTKTAAKFATGRRLVASDGRPLAGDLCMSCQWLVDWDADGREDLFFSEEDGAGAWCRNTGRLSQGMPVFDPPRYCRQRADKLKFGCLATPFCVDWDGDGDWDILAGNSAGYIAFFENLSGKGVTSPKWAAPKYLRVTNPKAATAGGWLRGDLVNTRAGDWNSPQGPVESKWGYTVVNVADWDGDGFLDVLANDVRGSVVWFRNPGQRGTTRLEAPRAIEVEWKGRQPLAKWEWRQAKGVGQSKALVAPWRTTPLAHDWNRDGLVDLVMIDFAGYPLFYERFRKPDGSLALKAPRHAFLFENGKTLKFRWGERGGSGRAKFCVADWDGDGRDDFILNRGNAVLFRAVGEKNGNWIFAERQPLAKKKLEGHTCCPSVCDFDADGRPELVIGAEDGIFYYLERSGSNLPSIKEEK